jgi:hypothetical protein
MCQRSHSRRRPLFLRNQATPSAAVTDKTEHVFYDNRRFAAFPTASSVLRVVARIRAARSIPAQRFGLPREALAPPLAARNPRCIDATRNVRFEMDIVPSRSFANDRAQAMSSVGTSDGKYPAPSINELTKQVAGWLGDN